MIKGRVDPQRNLRCRRVLNWHSIGPVGLGAIRKEEIGLTLIGTGQDFARVGSNALGAEPDNALAETARLALCTNEFSAEIDHQVVSLVRAVWD
jgi:hypothetical protein